MKFSRQVVGFHESQFKAEATRQHFKVAQCRDPQAVISGQWERLALDDGA